MNLSRYPRVRLVEHPTPFHRLPRFASELGLDDVWIKRDDLTTLGMGGNKARKLEFLIGEALDLGSDILITTGGVQSNHARMTAAAAARLGLEAHLFLTGDAAESVNGNLLLDELFGARLYFIGDQDPNPFMEDARDRFRREGRSAYVIPLGGSVARGSLGYVVGGVELLQQAWDQGVSVDHLIVAAGSCGMVAGLAVPLAQLSPQTTLHCISVSRSAEELNSLTRELAAQTAELLDLQWEMAPERLRFYDGQVGEGYTIPTESGLRAMRLLAQREGILTDPTYTAKALAGLMDLVQQQSLSASDTVVFLHSGGAPAIFSVPDVITQG